MKLRRALLTAAFALLLIPSPAEAKRPAPARKPVAVEAVPEELPPDPPSPLDAAPPKTPPRRTLVVPGEPGPLPPEAFLRAVVAAEESVTSSGKRQLVRWDEVADSRLREEQRSAEADGRRQLLAAREAFTREEFDVCAALAEKAWDSLLKGEPSATAPLMAEALTFKAAGLARDPSEESQRRTRLALESLFAVAPEHPMPLRRFDAGWRASIASLRSDAKAAPLVPFAIHADEGIRLQVDGRTLFRERGALALKPGGHQLHATLPGRSPSRLRLLVGPETEGTPVLPPLGEEVQPEAQRRQAQAQLRTSELPEALSRLAREAGADEVLFLQGWHDDVLGDRLSFVRAGVATQPFLGDDDLPAAKLADGALAGRVTTRLFEREGLRGSARVPGTEPGGGRPLLRIAGFASAGGAVLLAGLATGLGLGARSAEADFRATPQVDREESDRLRSRGSAMATGANVAWTSSVLALGAGAALVLLGWGDAPPAPLTSTPERP